AARIGRFVGCAPRRERAPGAVRRVHEPKVALVDGEVLGDEELAVVRRPVQWLPAPARELRQAAVAPGIAGIDHIDVPVRAVAARRAVGETVARAGPG